MCDKRVRTRKTLCKEPRGKREHGETTERPGQVGGMLLLTLNKKNVKLIHQNSF